MIIRGGRLLLASRAKSGSLGNAQLAIKHFSENGESTFYDAWAYKCVVILYTYIKITHYKLFSVIILTYKLSILSINYQLPHHLTINKLSLHHVT
jgi:hypothetical protein